MADLPKHLEKLRLTTREASAYLLVAHGVKYAAATLNKLRCIGGGPEFEKFRGSVFYPRAGIDAWVEKEISPPLASTSEAANDRQPTD